MITHTASGSLEIADPHTQGRLHPAVLAVSRAVGRSGWRVSSGIRPSQGPMGSISHSRGLAIDLAPQDWTVGGFGPKTALLFLRLAKDVAPNYCWFALAENDHIHLQLADRDFVGIQIAGHPHRYYDTNLKEVSMSNSEVRAHLFNNVTADLPREPIGDLQFPAESGDIILLPETGNYAYEDGDYEQGAHKTRAKRTVAKGRAKGAISKAAYTAVHRAAGPSTASQVVRAAQEGALNRVDWVQYEHVQNAVMLQSALGPDARLRPREVMPLLLKLVDFPAVQPRVLSLVWDAGTSTWGIDVDVALNTQLGIPVNQTVPYLGGVLAFPVSQLNQADNLQVTVSRALGVDTTLTTTLKLESKAGTPTLCFINGQIVSGQPRLHSPVMTAVASTSTNPYKLTISGLTNAYNPQLRLFVPGDTETERMFALLH